MVIIGNLSNEQQHILNRSGISYQNYVGLSLNEIVEQYQLCDLLLFASTYEGFGLPLLEAMSHGTPVLTSNCASMPEVAGDAGMLVDPCDVDSVAHGLSELLSHDARRNALACLAKPHAASFSWDRAAEDTLRIFDDAIGARKLKLGQMR